MLKLFLFLLIPISTFAMGKPRPMVGPGNGPAAGQFDTYVLAMSYMNDFCVAHPNKTECKTPLTSPEMALHGLWPNVYGDRQHKYQYCGTVTEADIGNDWCNATRDVKSKMDSDTFATLGEVEPGVQSCLYNHEWYAHGTCSGQSVDAFFKVSENLAKKFIALPHFQQVLKNGYGKGIAKSDILDALKIDMGGEVTDSVAIQCRSVKGSDGPIFYFSELQFNLTLHQLDQFPSSGSLTTAESKGNCPPHDIYISTNASTGTDAPSVTPQNPDSIKPSDDPAFVLNTCTCDKNPGKSYCHSYGFTFGADGTVMNYKDAVNKSIVPGHYSSVQDFITQKVCR